MKKTISFTLALLLISSALLCAPITANAASTINNNCTYYNYDNTGDYDYYWNWSYPIYSYLSVCNNGDLMRFQAIQSYGESLVMFAEFFDSNFNFKYHIPIKNELPLFGGFYSDGNNYYILSGQTNPDEDNSVEVFRLTKYDLNWNRISACSITDDNTTIPFDAGTPRFTHSGNQLLIRTDHEMYTASDGKNHQANVTLQINTSNMTLVSKRTCVLNSGYGYSSHSFNQFIKLDGNKIVAADHGDAYPRTLALFIYDNELSSYGLGDYPRTQCLSFLDIPGQIGANYTGCTMGGFEVSNSNYIIAGTKINLNDFENSTTKNVFISYIPKNSTTATVKMLTSYAEGTASATTPHFVKLTNNKFMVLWERENKTHYVLIDENGNKLSSEVTINSRLSDCPPVIYNNQLVWYTQSYNILTFNKIDLNDISKHQKSEINYGCEFVVKSTTVDTANVECKKCKKTSSEKIPEIMFRFYNDVTYSSTTCHVGYNSDFDLYLDDAYKTYKIISYNQKTATIKLTNAAIFSDFIIEIEDTSIASFTNPDYNSLVIKPIKNGKTKLTITSSFSASLKWTFDLEVCCDPWSQSTTYPTCESDGKRFSICGICDREWTEVIPATGHSEYIFTYGYPATCTQNGLTDGKYCPNCGKTTQPQKTIPATGHKEVTIKGFPSTCTQAGLTDGKKCSVCDTTTVAQQTIKAGHTTSVINKKAATCTVDGYTGDTFCSTCKTTTAKGSVIKAKGHTAVTVKGKAATCTETGLTDGKKCSVCGIATVKQQTIKATGHKEVVIPAVAPTYTTVGKTEGKKCSVCGIITVAQKEVAKLTLEIPVVKVANASNGVKVTWNKVANAEKYIVYSSTYNTKTKKWSGWTNRSTVTTTSWTDTKVKSGTKYKYTVRAVNGSVKSEYKSSSSILFLAQPTVKIANASTGVKVSWNKISGATGYKVYRSQYSNGKWSSWKSVKTIDKASTITWTDKSAKSGVKYKYTVKAVNGKAASTYKSSSSLLYLAQPTVTVKAVSNGVKVNWTQSSDATEYKIYRSEYNTKTKKWSGWKGIKTAKSTSKSYTDKSAKKGVQYKYTVKAVNGKVASTYKASGSVKR